MKKAFTTYFFSLCALLLIGHGHGYAHTAQESGRATQVGSLQSPRSSGFHNVDYHSAFIINPSPLGTKKSLEIEAIDIEEEELSSLKRYLGGSSFFTAVFCAKALGCFSHSFKRNLSFSTGFPGTTSHRWYIVFRVIRL